MKITEERLGKPFDPNIEHKKKRNSLLFVVLFLSCAVVFITIISIIISCLIKSNIVPDQKDVWTSSVASYWGGIIGGVISGILAFLGVFYTIRYYKDSDEQKERASVLPFLLVKEVDRDDLKKGFALGKEPSEKEKQKQIGVSIQNIGNGFATTLVIHTGYNAGGLRFNYVILVGESINIYFIADSEELKEGLCFSLQYVDSMTNEYIQEYTVKSRNDRISIDCGYPQLLE